MRRIGDRSKFWPLGGLRRGGRQNWARHVFLSLTALSAAIIFYPARTLCLNPNCKDFFHCPFSFLEAATTINCFEYYSLKVSSSSLHSQTSGSKPKHLELACSMFTTPSSQKLTCVTSARLGHTGLSDNIMKLINQLREAGGQCVCSWKGN